MVDSRLRRLSREALDVPALLDGLGAPSDGGVATFVGVVRDNQDGRAVDHLEYEAHEEMAEAQLARLAEEACRRWRLSEARLRHRVGRLEIGDVAVFVGTAAPHRAEALEACRWLIDTLKAEVPIFKKEHYSDGGESWVEEGLPPTAAG